MEQTSLILNKLGATTMNGFTKENTAEATHYYLGCDTRYAHFINNSNRSSTRGADNNKWGKGIGSCLMQSIQLSRPIGERKEDFLIPISYVKKFTPLVVGDEIYAEGSACNKVNALECWNDNSYRHDVKWYLVSFADRPNTGKQPVGGDVIVDVYFDSEDRVDKACSWRWVLGIVASFDIKSWKPNHAAMLKQYQAERGV